MKKIWSKWKQSEKGFTLVELLAVIVILGIILAIAIPAIGSIINKAEGDVEENQQELVIDAARLADTNGEFTGTEITVGDLIKNGYLEKNENTEAISTNKVVKTTDADGVITYTFE